MQKLDKIFIAGHKGLVGSAIKRRLEAAGYENLVIRNRQELDLRNQADVSAFFAEEKPDYVFFAAAKVGGILANSTYPADFMYENLILQNNILHQSYVHKVKKLVFLGSSCIYPKEAAQPIREESLLSGPLEPTNEAYALAKIAGVKMCQAYRKQYGCDFISLMPTNLYGPGDNYDLEKAHVLAALIRKCHELKESGGNTLNIWGTGRPMREFLYVDDLADACVFTMKNYNGEEPLNVGTGIDLSITELAEKIVKIVGVDCNFEYDSSKPDGTLRKQLDVSKLKSLGWEANTSLDQGIKQTYEAYLAS